MTADVKDVDMSSSHVSPLAELFDDAQSLIAKNPNAAIDKFKEIITKEADSNPDSLKVKEDAIYELVKIYAKQGRVDDLKALFILIQPFFQSIPKSRTAKIVRSLLDLSGTHATSGGVELQAEICRDAISWCEREKRTFLKQRLQARLAALDLQAQRYKDALRVISRVIRDVKKFDDKLLLVEISLIESRVYLALQNIAKAKGSLTAARSSANAIYCPPQLQSEIDLQAGTLCAEEKDYKTAFSYFYEAFEGYNTIKDTEHAITALKYMLLTKIMNQQAEDVYSIINGKAGVKYAGVEIESMRAVADAYKKRSIHAFEDVYKRFKAQLADDPIIYSHLNDLKDALLEQNLIRLIEPFSRVQIPHVAHLIQLPTPQVEAKLSEMILDKKLNGILDQGSGDLIVFDQVPVDKTYDAAISTIKELSNVVDRLYDKASKLT